MRITIVAAAAYVRNRAASKVPKGRPKQPLKGCKEAQRQLNAGARLDRSPPKPVAILEKIFDDAWLYTNAKPQFQHSSFVTPETSHISKPSEARGLNSIAVRILFEKNLTRSCKSRWRCDMFSCYWYPAWHPISLARKTRPAVAVFFKRGEQYNGEQGPATYASKNPFHYAVYRTKTARLMRRSLARAWLDNKAGPDGLYLLFVNRVPRDAKFLDQSMRKLVANISRSDTGWADKQAKELSLVQINSELEYRSYPPIQLPSNRDSWAIASRQGGSTKNLS